MIQNFRIINFISKAFDKAGFKTVGSSVFLLVGERVIYKLWYRYVDSS